MAIVMTWVVSRGSPGARFSGFGFRVMGLRLIGFKGKGVGNPEFPLKKHTLRELINHQPEAVPHAPGCVDFAFHSSPGQGPPGKTNE